MLVRLQIQLQMKSHLGQAGLSHAKLSTVAYVYPTSCCIVFNGYLTHSKIYNQCTFVAKKSKYQILYNKLPKQKEGFKPAVLFYIPTSFSVLSLTHKHTKINE